MFTTVEKLITTRNLKPKKKEGFLKVISIFSFLGIMLGVATLIIGYTSVASNQVKFTIDTKEYSDIGKVSFSSGLFNEVLKANRGAKTSTMKVSSNGLAHVSFVDGEYTSDYYFVAVDEAN